MFQTIIVKHPGVGTFLIPLTYGLYFEKKCGEHEGQVVIFFSVELQEEGLEGEPASAIMRVSPSVMMEHFRNLKANDLANLKLYFREILEDYLDRCDEHRIIEMPEAPAMQPLTSCSAEGALVAMVWLRNCVLGQDRLASEEIEGACVDYEFALAANESFIRAFLYEEIMGQSVERVDTAMLQKRYLLRNRFFISWFQLPPPSFLVELEDGKLDSAENLPEDKRWETETDDLVAKREKFLNCSPAFLSWLLPRKVVKKKK